MGWDLHSVRVEFDIVIVWAGKLSDNIPYYIIEYSLHYSDNLH